MSENFDQRALEVGIGIEVGRGDPATGIADVLPAADLGAIGPVDHSLDVVLEGVLTRKGKKS